MQTKLDEAATRLGSETRQSNMIITIDGPAGAGKSTVARQLAQRLGFEFLDTGAMYRAVAWECHIRKVDLNSQASIGAVAADVSLQFDENHISCNGRDVTVEIRSAQASHAASIVAAVPKVRDEITRLQREAAAGHDYVTEGRDQGTVAFPDAECKFFLTADTQERAERRLKELEKRGMPGTLEEVQAQIEDRDERDRTREIAPLVKADDALEVDTTGRTVDEVISLLEDAARSRLSLSTE